MDQLKDLILSYGDAPEDYQPEWIIEGIWQYNGVNFLAGPPKRARKTTLRRYWLACALTGHKVFGLFPVVRKVNKALVMIIEDHPGQERKVMDSIFRAMGKPGLIPNVDFISPIGFSLDKPSHLGQLLKLVKENEYDLVVIDPLIEFHGCDENSASEMRKVTLALAALKELAAVAVNHHSSKPPMTGQSMFNSRTVSEAMRGSTVLGGIADTSIRSHGIGTHKHRIKLIFEAKLHEEHDPMELDIDTETWMFHPVQELSEDLVITTIQNAGSLTREELVESLGRRKADVNKMVRNLIDANMLEEVQYRNGNNNRARKLRVIGS